jgi:hypothetical protein
MKRSKTGWQQNLSEITNYRRIDLQAPYSGVFGLCKGRMPCRSLISFLAHRWLTEGGIGRILVIGPATGA